MIIEFILPATAWAVGRGAWGGLHPEHFAAIAPVSGGIGPGGLKDVTTDLNKWQ